MAIVLVTGICYGHAGSGLVIQKNNIWQLRGIVTLAPRQNDECNLANYVIYTDVAKYIDWIKNKMVKMNESVNFIPILIC